MDLKTMTIEDVRKAITPSGVQRAMNMQAAAETITDVARLVGDKTGMTVSEYLMTFMGAAALEVTAHAKPGEEVNLLRGICDDLIAIAEATRRMQAEEGKL